MLHYNYVFVTGYTVKVAWLYLRFNDTSYPCLVIQGNYETRYQLSVCIYNDGSIRKKVLGTYISYH